jgi:hypothetical protein
VSRLVPVLVLLALPLALHGQDPETVQPPAPGPATEVVPPPETPPLAPPNPSDSPAVGGLDLPGFGAGGMGGFGGGGRFPFYQVTWLPAQRVGGQPTDLGMVRQDLGLGVPLWKDTENTLLANLGVRSELFQTDAVLPDSHQAFPGELWSIRLGALYAHQFDNGWSAGGGVSIGSASDKPFHSIQEMTLRLNAFLRIPSGEHNAWLFTLVYSPTSETAFPIPGVAYLWRPTDDFRATIGLPLAVWWRPTPDLTLEATYMLIRTVHTRATYRLEPGLRLYAGYDWNNESFFLADRTDNQERLFYYEQRLTTGVQWDLTSCFTLDLSGGYAFDRFYFQGRQWSDNHHDRIDVGDGPFLSLRGALRW